MRQDNEIFALILSKYHTQMTPAEKKIADYILDNPHESVTFDVKSLAQKTGTSEATVVRFARTLGYKGFLELKTELQRTASNDLALNFDFGTPSTFTTEINSPLRGAAEAEVRNIYQMVQATSPKSIEIFTRAIEDASYIYTWGDGVSSILARYTSYLLTLFGKRSCCLPERASSYYEEFALANPQTDVLWLYIYPEYSQKTLQLAQYAHDRGIRVVAITDRQSSPIVPIATQTVFAPTANRLPTNSLSATLVLISQILSGISHGRDSPSEIPQ